MKKATNIQRSIQLLNKMFKALNETFFNNELPTPVIVCSSTPNAYGHFTPWDAYHIKQENGEMTGAVEINIGSGTMDRPIEEVAATLQHECIHYYCYIKGIKDTSGNASQYHNGRFKEEAEKRGLIINKHPLYGWTLTEPGIELIEMVIEYGFEDILIGRNEFGGYFTGGGPHTGNSGTGKTGGTKKGNSHLLICPCCGTKIRYTTKAAPNVICGDCNEKFIEG